MTSAIDAGGKTAIVTGAASGIGRSLALQLADAGVSLALADVNEAGLQETADEAAKRGVKVMSRRVDVSSFEQVDNFAAAVFDWAESRVCLVFANAGIHGINKASEPDLDLWQRVVGINLMGPVHMTKAFLPRLKDQGIDSQFVITGSQASFLAAPGMAPYVSAKHALWGFADTLRIELMMEQSNVGVSLVAPSRVNTGMTAPQIETYRQQGGDKAAQDYAASMIGPDAIAEVVIREAKKRAFWIIPSHETTLDAFKARANAVTDAMPAGEIKVG